MLYRLDRDFFRVFCGLCFGFIAATGVPFGSSSHARASELRHTSTVKLVQEASPSIVNIHGQKTLAPADEGYRRGEPQNVNGMGTGVVIDERGYILTNHHVVDGVKEIQVTLADERTHIATLISHDNKTDLAVIKITVSRKLPVITIGTSSDLMVGEPVVAVGNAYGYEHTVTCGIVSALHRTVQVSDSQKYRDLIQTDASINPGNSGGPLLNADGEMIGINVAVRAQAQGIGFAIPVDMAMSLAANLFSVASNTSHGIVSKHDATGAERKLIVGDIDDESPAAKCGLQPGDVIASIGKSPVARPLDIERAFLGRKPGDEVPLTIHRNNQAVKVNLVLSSAPKRRAEEVDRAWELIGLRLEPVPAKQFQSYRSQYPGGLAVTAVRPNSPSFRQGIRQGDILVGMHEYQTTSLDNIEQILKRPDIVSLESVKFYILRNDGKSFGAYFGHLTVRR